MNWKIRVGDRFLLCSLSFLTQESFKQFVALCSVAASVCELKITDVRWMSTFADRDDMINGGTQWVGVLQREVHGLSTEGAYGLGL